MAKRSSKPTDLNKRAAAIVAQSTDPDNEGDDPYEGKNPHAVELGRLGGQKGGKAYMHYNFARRHQSLGGQTPAMAAGIADHPWTVWDIAELID